MTEEASLLQEILKVVNSIYELLKEEKEKTFTTVLNVSNDIRTKK